MSALPTGTGALVRFMLRRDRIRLPVWVIAITGLTAASAQAVQGLYDTQAERDVYAATVGSSPAAVLMSGPPTALDTLGGITVFEVNTVAVIATALMGLFGVVRHTRAEEESGRTELVRAAAVDRFAPVTAAVLVVGAACVLVGVGIAGSLLALGLPARGSLLYGASVGAVGLLFTAAAALAAQLTEHARGALGIGGAALAVSYVVRGVGDIQEGRALSWASPIGWAQSVEVFGANRWWPLLLPLALAAVLLLGSARLTATRDVGAGMVRPRPGSAVASRLLSGPFPLALRLQRGALAGWVVAVLALGASYGSFGRDVSDLAAGNSDLERFLGTEGTAGIEDAFFATALLALGVLSGGFAVSSALRTRAEESAGRLEPLLATALSRSRWVGANLAMTAIGSALVVLAGGLGAGGAAAISMGDAGQLGRLTLGTVAYLPAVLVLAGLVALLVGWVPRVAVLAWAGFAFCLVVGWLGTLLGLPDAVQQLSPFAHVPQAPREELTLAPLLGLAGVALALAAFGIVAFRRRDLV